MHTKSVFIPICLLFILFAAMDVPSAWASIQNNGSESVRVIILKKDNKEISTVVYPNQTILLPSGATKVTVKPMGSVREDVTVNVLIIQEDGKENFIEAYNKSILLGAENPSDKLQVVPTITNTGNISVIAVFEMKKGPAKTTRLYPTQSLLLPVDTQVVSIRPDGRVWGDENVEAEVILADGSSSLISRYGGKVSVIKEDTKIKIPSLTPS